MNENCGTMGGDCNVRQRNDDEFDGAIAGLERRGKPPDGTGQKCSSKSGLRVVGHYAAIGITSKTANVA